MVSKDMVNEIIFFLFFSEYLIDTIQRFVRIKTDKDHMIRMKFIRFYFYMNEVVDLCMTFNRRYQRWWKLSWNLKITKEKIPYLPFTRIFIWYHFHMNYPKRMKSHLNFYLFLRSTIFSYLPICMGFRNFTLPFIPSYQYNESLYWIPFIYYNISISCFFFRLLQLSFIAIPLFLIFHQIHSIIIDFYPISNGIFYYVNT